MRIVIFGGTGLLGSSIFFYLKKKNLICYVSSKSKKSNFKSDLLSEKKIFNFLKKKKPNIVINCSGETNVNLCNNNFIEAFKSNVLTVRNIVSAMKRLKKKIYFIHISTDQVYNCKKPNTEENTFISNNYGASKYLSEIEAKKFKDTLILRTNFFGKSKANNRLSFSDYLIENLLKKKNVYVPSNIYFNPIHIDYLTDIIFKFISLKINGTFNVGSKDIISKYDFAKKIALKYNLKFKYLKNYKSVYLKNYRPLSTYMSTKKLKKELRVKIPSIKLGIDSLE